MVNPDASLVRLERLQSLTPEQRLGLRPSAPTWWWKLASPNDEGPRGGGSALRHEMAAYRTTGAQRGWLLLPHEQAVEIWRADQAEPVRIDLAEIWEV